MALKETTNIGRSSTKAEYRVFATMTLEIMYLFNLLKEHKYPLKTSPTQPRTLLQHNSLFQIAMHFVRDLVQKGKL